MKSKKQLVLFTLFAMNLVDQPAPEVTIEQGTLSGKISGDGSFFEYLGIPYATTNSDTRFQEPQPPPNWKGVFRATEEIYQCPQNTPIGVVGSEDCLKINVYVPVTAQRPLPVMVYIQGGAFILGSGGKMIYAPDFIVQRDVVIVTFNYRLGVLGFLCLGIKEAPGNAGLKDQVAALRWVKKNIAAFGGDPDNVTIFGHSAGGTSVALLVASDVTHGLFNKAIIQSGSALTNWAIKRDPVAVASRTAKLLGYDVKDPKELYDLFSKLPYEKLVSATAKIPIGQQITTQVLHLPCIEEDFGKERFLNDLPYNLVTKNSKNITLMYGSMDKEGLFFVSEETDESLKQHNHKNLFADDLEFKSKEEEQKMNEVLKQYYFGNEEVSRKMLMNLSDLYTDLHFEMPMLIEAEIMTQKMEAPVFIYHFKYAGGRNMVKQKSGFVDEPGACHGDDILYMFKGKLWPYRIKEADQRMIDWMTDMITNFAKYGNPTPDTAKNLPVKWQKCDKEKLKFLYVDNELKMGPIPNPEAFRIWKNLYNKYRRL
ncbi:esterase FE4-like isoform X2 [Anticarsia gemmatalis]|uniref:esterase FE4-like isoform X2 n=1 Tax=Anticarsia gemmatalis TaxID=129554 RepID=UPI003F776897